VTIAISYACDGFAQTTDYFYWLSMVRGKSLRAQRRSVAFVLGAGLLILLWVAGGASRADVMGQPVVRLGAWIALIAALLAGQRLALGSAKAPATLLLAGVVLVALQLVPLPPALWSALPGRDIFLRAAEVTGQPQPWRPISISPGATLNSLMALIVPAAVLYLAAQMSLKEHWRFLKLLVGLIAASALLALAEFTGQPLDHPFVNDVPTMISANFANRNHLALLLSFGLVGVFALASEGRKPNWAPFAALAAAVFMGLAILSTGSRAGLLVGLIAAVIGLITGRRALSDSLGKLTPKMRILAVIAVTAAISGLLLAAVAFDRAASFERVATLSVEDDLRLRSQPVVIRTIWDYFPVGAGFGTFDPAYRINEPDTLLSPKYFNRAHNDWLEILFEAGLAGAALMIAAVGWFVTRTYRVWREDEAEILPRLGSAFLGLTLVASAFDYPARTPLIMAIGMIAAVWLARRDCVLDETRGGAS
jgi:O-antigen ligase